MVPLGRGEAAAAAVAGSRGEPVCFRGKEESPFQTMKASDLGEEDDLTPDDKMLRFVDDNGLVPSSSGTVYDRTTVLIEQDPGTLEDEDDDGQCGEHLPFLVE
ncbi:hypothetical protein A6R68_20136, partial [Neotoma lepida]